MRPKCKRRKPQPLRAKAKIYRDPHDKKKIQLSFPSNDGLFNGADPFLILFNLGNADTKALIPSAFTKCPKVVPSEDELGYSLQFCNLDTTDPSEYVLKYMCKSPFPSRTNEKILEQVVKRMAYSNKDATLADAGATNINEETANDVNKSIDRDETILTGSRDMNALDVNNDDADRNSESVPGTIPNGENTNNNGTFQPRYLYSMYNQAASESTVCLFMAMHLCAGLPITLQNYTLSRYNILGRKTITRKAASRPPGTSQLYAATCVEQFDRRKDYVTLPKDRTRLKARNIDIIENNLTMRTFLDLYKVRDERGKGERLCLRRRWTADHLYNAIQIVPHTNMSEANPKNRSRFGNFCKKMVILSGKYAKIAETIQNELQTFIPTDTNITDPKEVEAEYFIQKFYQLFPPPNFEGIEPSYKSNAQHYHRKMNEDHSSSDSDDDDNENDSNTIIEYESKGKSAVPESKKSNAKISKEKYYQNQEDLLYAPGGEGGVTGDNLEFENDTNFDLLPNEDLLKLNGLSDNFIQLPTVESDCREWADRYHIDLNDFLLPNRLKNTFEKLKKGKGKPAKEIPLNPQLTVKQQIVKEMIKDFVEAKHEQLTVNPNKYVAPLRLFVIGIPGAGKTFAFHVAATDMISVLGDDWTDYVRLACPTGSVAYHMAYGAKTIHSTFLIEVGKVGKSLDGQVNKMKDMCKNNPKNTFLVIFDEVSMVSAEIFSAVCKRLVEAKIDIEQIGFIFFGDPAQCEPIGGRALWTTLFESEKGNSNKKPSLETIDGPAAFRHIMGMTPMDEIPCYKNRKSIEKLREKQTLTIDEINEIKAYDQQLGQAVYKGNYQAVYLDEVQRTDGTEESRDYVTLNTKCRYGKYRGSLTEFRKLTASKEEFENDSNFAQATHLTGFHFHQEGHPGRTTADSENAQNLSDESIKRNRPIMLFKATHTPESEASSLEQASPKLFRNMRNNLYLIEGAPVIITRNIRACFGLFNGAKGEFIGPLYIRKEYQVTDFETFSASAVDKNTLKTTKQVQIKLDTGKSLTLPAGTSVSEINGADCTSDTFNQTNETTFQNAKFVFPRRPPFLPDYLVVKVPGYADAGGPSFFPGNPELKDFVCIPPYSTEKKSEKCEHRKSMRNQFPLELAYVMTAYKGIGDNHIRTVIKLKGKNCVPGLFLVACTRCRNPKHVYIHPDHWPTEEELMKQRFQRSVLEAENLERIVRSKSAQIMRKSRFHHTLPHFPLHIDKDVVNTIADLIHCQWLEIGNAAKSDDPIQLGIKNNVSSAYNAAHGVHLVEKHYEDVLNFMKTTDEYMLLSKVPHISYDINNKPYKSKNTEQKSVTPTNFTHQPIRRAQKRKLEAPLKTQHHFLRANKQKQITDIQPVTTSCEPISNASKYDIHINNEIDIFRHNRPLGLLNKENNCYINAPLQMLMSLAVHNDSSLHNSIALQGDPHFDFAREYFAIADVQSGFPLPVDDLITSFFNLPAIQNEREFDRGSQQDIRLAFTNLLQNQYIFDQQNFKIPFTHKRTGNICKHSVFTHNSESSTELTLHHGQLYPITLQNLIERHFESHLVPDFPCPVENCSQPDQIHTERKILLEPLPPFIVVSIQRTILNDKNVPIKNFHDVYLEDNTIHLSSENEIGFQTTARYSLQGAVSHKGFSCHGGHFVGHVQYNNQWYLCDDYRITKCSISDINPREIVALAFKRDDSMADAAVHNMSESNHSLSNLSGPALLPLPAPLHTPKTSLLDLSGTSGVLKNSSAQNPQHKIVLIKSDITAVKADCIVNAANESLEGGGGIDHDIHRAAGPQLRLACIEKKKELGWLNCPTGEAVITPSFNLANKSGIRYIVHTVGPRNHDDSLLAKCYENSLNFLINHNDVKTMAIPCIATGIFNFDAEKAANIAMSTVKQWLEINGANAEQIIFCTYLDKDYRIYKNIISRYFSDYSFRIS